MVITVEDDPHSLVELLWIRERWGLSPVGTALPPLLLDDSVGAHTETDASARIKSWQDAWPAIWEACLSHAGRVQAESRCEQLRGTVNGSAERAELLRELAGPSWRAQFGDDAITAHYETWNVSRLDARARQSPQPFDEQPERVSLAALIPAWQSGLCTIVVIPCLGSYTRTIGPHSLIVTSDTRNDPKRYGLALAQFR
jgi:hypothetical protein